MVDALSETRRVLVPGGILFDLRPRSAKNLIQVVTARSSVTVAEIEAYGAQDEDAAADAAIEHGVASRWFLPAGGSDLDFEFYWDTVEDMREFVATSRRMREAHLPYDAIEARRREAGPGARLRCHRPMMLRVYRTGKRPSAAGSPAMLSSD